MRNIKLALAAFTVAGLATLPLASQEPSSNPTPAQPAAPAQPSPQTGANSSAAPSSANSPDAANLQLSPVVGELVNKLDSKNAKTGDQVVVKTTEKATTADGMEIPKGSKIVGHVVDVTAHDNENNNSKLTLQFDQAQLKSGQTLPIKSVLQSLSPAEDTSMRADTMSAPTGSAGSAAPMASGGSSGGGMTGSSASRTPSAGSSSTPAAPSMSSSSQGSTQGNAPQTGTVVARQGNVEVKTTAIPGVLIGSSANGQPFANASGVLVGARQNVHLDGGTKVVLAVAEANSKPSSNR